MSDVPARALFHTAPRCVEIREVPTPRPAAGEVLVRTLSSGISGGTERLVYRGEVPADLALDDTIDALGGAFSYPFAYGYACVGKVAESGQRVFAFHPHQDMFTARAGELIPLPGTDPASATLLPLVETALQVTLDAGAGYRDRVIVLGAGVLGLLTGLLLHCPVGVIGAAVDGAGHVGDQRLQPVLAVPQRRLAAASPSSGMARCGVRDDGTSAVSGGGR